MDKLIFDEIRKLKRQILPDQRVLLYGSQARGDEREDSDWDILILLDKDKRDFQDQNNYAYPFTELGLDYDVFISARVFTKKDWERQKPSLFYKNVEQDAIEIV
jgi:predicted nucleotidyltransferase